MLGTMNDWWKSKSPVRGPRARRFARPRLERLESRIVFAVDPLSTASLLHFTSSDTAHVGGFLASANEVDLYKVHLGAGDRISSTVSGQAAGGLQSLIRVFDSAGRQRALDDQEGGDPRLSFQAKTAGDYFIGISASGDDAYDPVVINSGHGGRTSGLYSLDVRLTPNAPLLSDLTGGSFRLTTGDTAVLGGTVSGTFVVENRGGADAGGFTVQVVLSSGSRFDGLDPTYTLAPVFASGPPAGLGAGRGFADSFTVQLPPDVSMFSSPSGPVYLGLLITPGDPAHDLSAFDKSGVHRGADWEALTVVTPVAAGVTDLSTADPGLNTRVDARTTLGRQDHYQFSLLVPGRFTAELASGNGGASTARLTLIGPDGQAIVQSEGAGAGAPARIVQYLRQGTYQLAVDSPAPTPYQLTTRLVDATSPLDPLPVGAGPQSIATADFNGDGFADLVTLNRADYSASVLLGNGDGSFQRASYYPVALPSVSVPIAVAVADINGDGRPDLVVVYGGTGTLTTLLGNGDGSFAPGPNSPNAGRNPSALAVADVNGDGIPDAVVANLNDAKVTVLLGDGTGAFGHARSFAAGANPDAVALADFDGDGMPDIATANGVGDSVSVLRSDGHGSFLPQQVYQVSSQPYEIAAADVNGDGRADLVVGDHNGGDAQFEILINKGDGTFLNQRIVPLDTRPLAIAVADLNGDGKLDLVSANGDDSRVSVLLGNGDGTFRPKHTFNVGSGPVALAVGDFDGDGHPDLADANDFAYANSVSVLLGNGDGSFRDTPEFSVDSGAQGVVSADVNGDGIADLIVADYFSRTASVLLGNGDGTFQPKKSFAAGDRPSSVVFADLNRDGRIDVVVTDHGLAINHESGAVSVLLGNGDGTFHDQAVYATGFGPFASAVGDINADGIPDLVTADNADGTASVRLGAGDGTFGARRTFAAGSRPQAIRIADLNGDGKADVVVTNNDSTTVSILFGDGKGSFASRHTVAVGSHPDSVEVADLNGDLAPDLIVANIGDNTMSVLLGDGHGGFTEKLSPDSFGVLSPLVVGGGPNAVRVAYMNGDNKLDLVTDNSDGTISVLLGIGDGSFQPEVTNPVGSRLLGLALADFNKDGLLDVASPDFGSASVVVLLGNGAGTFAKPRFFDTGSDPTAVAVAELNGDGHPDVVTANYGSGTIGVLLANGDGTFQSAPPVPVDYGRHYLALGDVDGDGCPDLVVTSYDGYVSVRIGDNAGGFHFLNDLPTEDTFVVGDSPNSVALADVDGDGNLDILVTELNNGSVVVLLGDGTGHFHYLGGDPTRATFPVGVGPTSLTVGDFNADGRPDLVVTDAADSTASVLLGNGDGSFQPRLTLPVGVLPNSSAIADLNGDGFLDLVVGNTDGTASIFLGNGDGSFRPPQLFFAGSGDSDTGSFAVADVNGDGRPDIVVLTQSVGEVGFLPGLGDGTFGSAQPFAVGDSPDAMALADLDGDGRPDLVVANAMDSTISVLANVDIGFVRSTPANGGGTRNTPLLADLNGDGVADTVVLDRSGDILYRQGLSGGKGTFAPPKILNPGRPARDIAILRTPTGWAVAAADAQADSDLSANGLVYTVSVYRVARGGAISRTTAFASRSLPTRIFAGDLTGDGLDDLVIADALHDSVSVAFQTAAGRFTRPLTTPVGVTPSDVSLVDVNGDGLRDIVVGNQASGDVTVLLDNDAHVFASNSDPAFHLLADLDGDGIPDNLLLLPGGIIFFESGSSSDPGSNPLAGFLNIHPIDFARDMTAVRTATGWAVAAIPSHPDPDLSSPGDPVYTVSLYALQPGRVVKTTLFSTSLQPNRIAAADLNGDGLDDIVVTNPQDQSVSISYQTVSGAFAAPVTVPVGLAPSAVSFVDVDRDGLIDIVASDQAGGKATVLLEGATHTFGSSRSLSDIAQKGRFRGGIGLTEFDTSSGKVEVLARAQSVGLASGDLTGDGRNDLVVVNRATHSFSVLRNDGRGGFADPQAGLTTSTSFGLDVPDQPGPAIVGDFFHDGKRDVAVLMTDTSEIWVFHNKGDGTFDSPVINYAGSGATGFSFVAARGTSPDRFFVGNGFGDILTLDGDGTGKFEIDRSDLNSRPLAVGKTPDGRPFAVVADPKNDKVQVHFRDASAPAGFDDPQSVKSKAAPLLAPGAVVLGDLQSTQGKTPPYLIVANRLGNQVLVYPGLQGGGFAAPTAYAVGADPAAVTVADLDGDGVPDLVVVNHGSNDLSILVGNIDPTTGLWFAKPGPRLDTGGNGPIAVDVADFNGDGIPDLRVTNADGTISTLGGIGSGGKGSAFFAPATGIQNLGAPITAVAFDPTTNREFVVSGGAIRAFDGAAFTAVASAGSVSTLGVVDGLLVAGFADGSVGLMTEDGTLLAQSSSFGDQPSALQALQDGNAFDVYLTLEGSSVPAFVSLLVPVVTELPTSPAVTQTTSLPNAELVLVATLLSGTLEEGTRQDTQVANGESSFLLFLPPVKVSATNAETGQIVEESLSVALVVRAGLDGLPPTAEFKERVEDALKERLATRQVFDSVEDLVEAIKQVLDQFKGESKQDDEPSAFEGDLAYVALDRIAEATVRGRTDWQSVQRAESPEPNEGESLWSFQAVVLVSWLCRAPQSRQPRDLVPARDRNGRRATPRLLPKLLP